MRLHQSIEVLLRLFMGCQMWFLWQPDNPFVNRQILTNIRNIFAAIPHNFRNYDQNDEIRKKRTC
jgi:hypothetical protein